MRWPRLLFALTIAGPALAGCGGPGSAARPVGTSLPEGWAEGKPAAVIGSGETVRSYQYEVIAGNNHGETCIGVLYPRLIDVTEAENCLTGRDSRRQLAKKVIEPWFRPAPPQFSPDAEHVLMGLASPKVARVHVSYRVARGTRNVDAVLSELTPELARKVGVEDHPGFFFLPVPATTEAKVSAFDRHGRRLARWPRR